MAPTIREMVSRSNGSHTSRSDTPESGESRGNEGSQILDLIRLRTKNEYGNSAAGKVLLMLDALVNGHQHIKFRLSDRE